jgi:hypothetical protein
MALLCSPAAINGDACACTTRGGPLFYCTADILCFLNVLTCVCVREKASLPAARVSLRLARMPRPVRARRSHRLRATLAAAPVLFAHAFGPCHKEKIWYPQYQSNAGACPQRQGAAARESLKLACAPKRTQGAASRESLRRAAAPAHFAHTVYPSSQNNRQLKQ